MFVNICGIPHDVVEVEDNFDIDCHLGMIDYKTATIKINKELKGMNRTETLCHEMVHGMLIHIGRQDLSDDETFVQSLGNAIMHGFDIREIVWVKMFNFCDFCEKRGKIYVCGFKAEHFAPKLVKVNLCQKCIKKLGSKVVVRSNIEDE